VRSTKHCAYTPLATQQTGRCSCWSALGLSDAPAPPARARCLCRCPLRLKHGGGSHECAAQVPRSVQASTGASARRRASALRLSWAAATANCPAAAQAAAPGVTHRECMPRHQSKCCRGVASRPAGVAGALLCTHAPATADGLTPQRAPIDASTVIYVTTVC
jgi:hypothetical protein